MQPLEMGWFVVAGGVVLVAKTVWDFCRTQKLLKAADHAYAMQDQGKRPEAIAFLEALLKHRSSIPIAALPARLALATFYQAEGRHADAEAQARAALNLLDTHGSTARMPDLRAIKPELYRRLSDALESQGKMDEAHASLREANAAVLLTGDDTAANLEQRALQLEMEGKHLEAARLFVQAGQSFGKARNKKAQQVQRQMEARSLCLASGAYYNAGHFSEGLDAGRNALRVSIRSAETGLTIIARLQTANCAIALADMDIAQQMAGEATILARKRGQPDEIAQCLLVTAHVHLMVGDLDRVEQVAQEAVALSPAQQYIADANAFEADILRGEYARALTRMQKAQDTALNPYAFIQRRLTCVFALGRSQALLEMERYEDALTALAEAEEALAKDECLWRTCQAGWLWAKAGQGESDAREQLQQFATMLEGAAREESNLVDQRDLFPLLARGFMLTGDFNAALEFWGRYLSARPRPVYLPYCNCCRGDCSYALGDREAARQAWQAAAESGLDTFHARLARERLAAHPS